MKKEEKKEKDRYHLFGIRSFFLFLNSNIDMANREPYGSLMLHDKESHFKIVRSAGMTFFRCLMIIYIETEKLLILSKFVYNQLADYKT